MTLATVSTTRLNLSQTAAHEALGSLRDRMAQNPFDSRWGARAELWTSDPTLQQFLELTQRTEWPCRSFSISSLDLAADAAPEKCIPYINGGGSLNNQALPILKQCAQLLMQTPLVKTFLAGLGSDVELTSISINLKSPGQADRGFDRTDRFSIDFTVHEKAGSPKS